MAAADHFLITVRGTPGHAASPQQGPDAVLVASEVVTGLQAIVSRMRDPADPVVVSVGMIHGGTRHNILPAEVQLEGTIRTFRESTRTRIAELLRRRVQRIASSLGARAQVRVIRGYPVLVNEPRATQVVAAGLEEELGRDRVVSLDSLLMGAEDFSRYLEKVPGTFLRLGVRGRVRGASLHSPEFAPPEEVLVVGAAALAASAVALQRA
jgi:amidohydrolase